MYEKSSGMVLVVVRLFTRIESHTKLVVCSVCANSS